jgi:hypothetical protein
MSRDMNEKNKGPKKKKKKIVGPISLLFTCIMLSKSNNFLVPCFPIKDRDAFWLDPVKRVQWTNAHVCVFQISDT